MLREHMKTNETFDRIIDVFAKLDTDGSGQVDHKEFETGVMGTIANCDPADVFELFCEVDQDGSGQISYLELKESFRAADERASKSKLTVPDLPHNLQRRRKEIITLYRQFEEQQQQQRGKRSIDLAQSVRLSSFIDCLRLYYPKDSKETIMTIDQWIRAYLVAKESADEEKTRKNDDALILALDKDGDERISITEFCELSKTTGLSKVQIKARFREKDFGNVGFLTMQQMREVLRELREEGKRNAVKR